MIQLRVRGVNRIRNRLNKVPRNMEVAAERTIRELHTQLYRNTPVRTGRLRRSLRVIKVGALKWKIIYAAPYAVYVEARRRFIRKVVSRFHRRNIRIY